MAAGYRRYWLVTQCLWTAVGLAVNMPEPLPLPPPPCLSWAMLSPAELEAVRPEFLAAHNKNYSLAIEMPEPRNQCQLGICWAYAMTGDLENEVFLSTGKRLEFSEAYLVLQALREKIEAAIENPGEEIKPGLPIRRADELFAKYGVMPAGAWKPRARFSRAPNSKRMMNYLNERVERFHFETAELTRDDPRYQQARRQALTDIDVRLKPYFGELPEKVEFEGSQLTPVEIYRRLLPHGIPRRRVLMEHPPLPEALAKSKTGADAEEEAEAGDGETAGWPAIQEYLKAQLKAGHIVPLSIEMAREFVDKQTGIMSISAFHTPPGYRPVSKAYRRKFYERYTNHALEIVAVDLDDKGNIIKMKVRDSKGKRSGDRGYYHMYPDYFRAYANSILIRDPATSSPPGASPPAPPAGRASGP